MRSWTAALLKRLIKIKKCLSGEAIISEAAPLVKAIVQS
jgi:hypothetical protein